MLGAIIGDIVGSTREWHNVKTEDFELLPQGSRFTDDSVMTLAVAQWLMDDHTHSEAGLVKSMQTLGRRYPHAGYGGMFRQWLMSDNPKPYGSFGNGSAMRVSPVGLYANSLDEALELARISASVTHNHPDGIKGAQAIAACVYLKKTEHFNTHGEIKRYIERNFGYNLDVDLKELRPYYSFDVTCQGSVPIAIMAYLQQPYSVEKALRLAVSMGGDSDTIGCMTCAIASASEPHVVSSSSLSGDIVKKCRTLLPHDLLEINDRFEAFISRPLYQSFDVFGNGLFYAGEYPGDKDEEKAKAKINNMTHFGVRHFIDLTEEHELRPYAHLLPQGTTYMRFPIKDCGTPKSIEDVDRLLNRIDMLKQQGGCVYIHCWGGIGRTGTIVACHIARNLQDATPEEIMSALRNHYKKMPKAIHRHVPDTVEQEIFIKAFVESRMKYNKETTERVHDCIRGSLMAGAAGDALGYPVEFMSRKAILSHYGGKGITQFELHCDGKALVSDDTQMTLFTANGMLMGLTRGYMRGIGGAPEDYVGGAYLDWYYTQTGKKRDILENDFHYTWLRDLPELAHRRAPGSTCLRACESIFNHEEVVNNSCGCGGIMRVAPMGLLQAGYLHRKENCYSAQRLAKAGAEIARVTHKHPLGFLPAAMLTNLLCNLVPLSVNEAKEKFTDIVEDAIKVMDDIYKGEYREAKSYLSQLTRTAVRLALTDTPDADAIRQLGEGWTAEETWAIAVFCSLRHIDSPRDAIIAAVNHDGDSDSTGSVAGNIIGAIHGYKVLKEQHLFCPTGKEIDETLELSNLILTLADDLYKGCVISEYSPIDTPEKRRWYERYCEMKPVGI